MKMLFPQVGHSQKHPRDHHRADSPAYESLPLTAQNRPPPSRPLSTVATNWL